jgi:hypothetical protein
MFSQLAEQYFFNKNKPKPSFTVCSLLQEKMKVWRVFGPNG